MEVFNKNYQIDYMFLNNDLTSDFVGLAAKMQETFLLHSKDSGYPLEWLLKNKLGFVLVGWNVRILEYPVWGEIINIATWPSKYKGFIIARSFSGRNSSNKVIFQADTEWVFMDLNEKKPIRAGEQMKSQFGPSPEPALGEKIHIPDYSNYVLCRGTTHTVNRRDTDSNRHANNISYIMWAMNLVPDDYYAEYRPDRVMVKYHRESRLNDELNISLLKSDNEFVAVISSGDSGEIRALVYSTWKRKGSFLAE